MPDSTDGLTREEIDRFLREIITDGPDAGRAKNALVPLGRAVVPHLAEGFSRSQRWQERVAYVFLAIQFARVSEPAFRLGVQALADRSYMVRYRGCMVLAYSLRKDAVPELEKLLSHPDERTVEHASRAIDAIQHGNHHYFVDRDHSGRSFWVVNEADDPTR